MPSRRFALPSAPSIQADIVTNFLEIDHLFVIVPPPKKVVRNRLFNLPYSPPFQFGKFCFCFYVVSIVSTFSHTHNRINNRMIVVFIVVVFNDL